jgi:outer membrane receptor protein involved in Fe transport
MGYAQNTGKLAGRVIDGSTGESLPGAAVVLAGTLLGTASDTDGNYFIIGVPVGTYSVQAQFVGYQTETITGVDVSSGYTREINFTLTPGVELDEIVVEYERPLIQKDALGVPKIVNSEEIMRLPVRGVAAVAKIQAGVVSKEGSGSLNIRGGRGSEVTYYVDGIKNAGAVPQSAIQEQEMMIGSINARYGDAMSGIINITTKSGKSEFFGSAEAVTSSQLDDFGYNLASATLGGPIIANKLSFFVAGEFRDQLDRDPRAIETAYLSDAQLDDLRGAPSGLLMNGPDGSSTIVPIPGALANGTTVAVNDDGTLDLSGGGVTLSDGTVLPVPEGYEVVLNPVSRAEHLTRDDFEYRLQKRSRNHQRLWLNGNLTWNVIESGRLRLGGQMNTSTEDQLGGRLEILAPETKGRSDRSSNRAFATWTQYLSQSTFYQLQADYWLSSREDYDPRFGTDFSELIKYGDIDDPVHSSIRAYRNLTFTTEERVDDHGTPDDPSDDTTTEVRVPTYVQRYQDGINISTATTASMVSLVGGTGRGYSKRSTSQIRLSASATTQVGLNQIEFGGEFEQRTSRYWGIGASRLARFIADGDPEQIADDDPFLDPDGYSRYEDIPSHILYNYVGYYGWDVRGNNEIDAEDLNRFVDTDKEKPDDAYNIKPYQPIYYGGYVQDKIEFRDIVLNVGLRVDVFDNNQPVFKDKYARRPIERAGDSGQPLPAGIQRDYAVYFSGNNVVGYRDLNGSFYDAEGQPTNAGSILLNGLVNLTDSQINLDMFEDYEPQVSVMPRIGVSFPVSDQALFFASYGKVAQRPSSRNFASLDVLRGTSGASNNNLKPEETTKYELGFRQRLGARSALTISGFFHQINNLIQIRNLRDASPSGYSRFENVDFGTVKGLEFGYDLRRTNGVAVTTNYTISFASGTGSGDRTTGTIVWVDETPPNFISPLDFDQRHKLNLSVDYRLGEGEGPTVMGAKILENFGVNVLATAGSGFPYTGAIFPVPVTASRAPSPRGGVNEDRMPWSSRIDLRLDRRFAVGTGGTNVTAFLWIQNVLDTRNTQNVWRFSGLVDNDGFLATAGGVQFLESAPPSSEVYYQHRNRNLNWVGIPRLTRLGVRVDF